MLVLMLAFALISTNLRLFVNSDVLTCSSQSALSSFAVPRLYNVHRISKKSSTLHLAP